MWLFIQMSSKPVRFTICFSSEIKRSIHRYALVLLSLCAVGWIIIIHINSIVMTHHNHFSLHWNCNCWFLIIYFDSFFHFNFFFCAGKVKICCTKCQKKCSGEVLRVAEKYFHKQCFQCHSCRKSLAAGGFFSKDNTYYCTSDYQKLFGTKCAACNLYVEGEVVSTMGNTYHQSCFTCSRCTQPFQSGSKVSKTMMWSAKCNSNLFIFYFLLLMK